MRLLEKLKFWKHEEFQPMDSPDPLARQDPLQQDFNPAEQPDPYAQLRTPNYPQAQSFPGSAQPQAFAQYPESATHRDPDTELILARLDAIKSDLDAITQRLRILEQRTETRTGQQRYW